jgi:hypothetical protein
MGSLYESYLRSHFPARLIHSEAISALPSRLGFESESVISSLVFLFVMKAASEARSSLRESWFRDELDFHMVVVQSSQTGCHER